MCEEKDGKFYLKRNFLARLPKPVELSHKWVLGNFNYQEPSCYAKLFGKYEEASFECLPDHIKANLIIKQVLGAPKLYILQESNKVCVFCNIFTNEEKYI